MSLVSEALNLFIWIFVVLMVISAFIGFIGFIIDVIRFPLKKSRIEKYYDKLDKKSDELNAAVEESTVNPSDVEIDIDIDSIIEED